MAVATQVEDTERTDRGEQKQNLFGASINVVGIVNMKTFLSRPPATAGSSARPSTALLTDPEFLELHLQPRRVPTRSTSP